MIKSEHFDFVKRDRNVVTTPVVNKSLKWEYKNLKELCGQGKIYVRLNIDRECVELNPESQAISSSEDDEALFRPAFSGTTAATSSTNNSNDYDTVESVSASGNICHEYNSSATVSAVAVPVGSADRERLGELLPFTTVEDIDNALSQYGSINMAADALVEESNLTRNEEKLQEEV